MNYNDETIPAFEEILDSIKNKLGKTDGKLYCFSDLYSEKGNEWIKITSGLSEEILKHLDRKKDFKGLYILTYEDGKVQYVGISKNVLLRIKQHFVSNSHYSASLVYLMALKEHEKRKQVKNKNYKYKDLRKDLPNFKNFRKNHQQIMRERWKISFVPESDGFHLHVLEAYAACELKAKWNSFQTH